MGLGRSLAVGIMAGLVWAGASELRADDAKTLDANGLVFVSQDSASIERQIASYLQAHYGFSAKIIESKKNPDDIYLRYAIAAADGIPELKLYIDTMVSGNNRETKAVSERVITVTGYFSGAKACSAKPECRCRLLEVHNRLMTQYWMPHQIFVDKDGDVAFRSYANIASGTPVHVEQVNDLLVRMISAWRKYNEAIREEFGSLP